MFSKARIAFTAALALFGLLAAGADAGAPHRPLALHPVHQSKTVAFMGHLHDGRIVTVYTDARATIVPPPQTQIAATSRAARVAKVIVARQAGNQRATLYLSQARYGPLDADVAPSVRHQILFDIEHPPQRYVPGRVIVVFKPGVTISQDHDMLTAAAATTLRKGLLARRQDLSAHPFTNDQRTNLMLMQLGVDRADRVLSAVDRGTLSSMRSRAEARIGRSLLAFDNAFVLHAGASSVESAIHKLRTSASIAYAAPDYAVSTMIAGRRAVPADVSREIAGYKREVRAFGRSTRSVAPSNVPQNSAVTFNLQAMLDAPGVDAIAPFDEIGQRFSQLPGAGEIITNIGLGDADDASAATNPNDPCYGSVSSGGPTTRIIGGQRYLDMPSLPLIPVWVSDPNGGLAPTGETCNVDASLAEVGLDFSVMAPLPDGAQRPGETATVNTDLLGIAPGASYRWIAPGTTTGALGASDLLGAFIAAGRQQPAPNVITASLGWGADGYGFPSRYLEDDPLSQSVIASLVSANIVVCISANDGTRAFTSAAIGPSGGSAATNTATVGTTNLDDLYYTTVASAVPDSGAIDVGASTLDDIFSANPQDGSFGALAGSPTFAETRFNGTLGFSSGFGTRVNVSAPGDNIEALYRNNTAYDSAGLEIVGGTSASAPEVAAAAAVALQVGRLTGHPLASATAVRDLMIATGTTVATPPQADVNLHVGPQVSVRRVVEKLLADSGKAVEPGVARVAVHGRRSGSFIAQQNTSIAYDAVYVTALDPSYIKLDGPFTVSGNPSEFAFPGTDTGAELNSYITIAPDWEGIPSNATFRLTVAGQPARVIATSPSVRLLPAQLFAAAGVALTPGATKTLSLTYSANAGLHTVAESTFQLVFGPPAGASRLVLAPKVPAVVSGATIPVSYDLRTYPSTLLAAPTLNVSMPDVAQQRFFATGMYPYYSVPLTGLTGTVNVPVSALAGAGMYTIWINLGPAHGPYTSDLSDLAFTRVDAGTARPAAPLLSLTAGGPGAHSLTVPYKGTFSLAYDVSMVPGATGALVEISAPPPSPYFFTVVGGSDGLNSVRNPNGNAIDDDGVITGSIYHQPVSGTTGTVTIDPAVAGIPATTTANVRVIPTAGGTPIAEASDIDTIGYGGIDSVFGFPLDAVFIDPIGTDGYLSEFASVGTQQVNTALFTIEPFDLKTGAVSGIPLSFTNNNTSFYPIVQNDVGISWDTLDFTTATFYRANPLAAGFTPFTFPDGTLPSLSYLDGVAGNSTPTRSAYIAQDLNTGDLIVTRGDVTTGTGFSPGIDVTGLLGPNYDFVGPAALAYDWTADRAYFVVQDGTVACNLQSPSLVTVDFATGTASSRQLTVGAGSSTIGGYMLQVDPVTHIGALATSCGIEDSAEGTTRAELTLIDLPTGNVSRVFQHVLGAERESHNGGFVAGGDSATIGLDPVNHLILQRSIFCPQMLNPIDMNARACLNLYDEGGRLVKTIKGLFPDGFADGGIPFNGVNGTTRTGVAMGQQSSTVPTISSFNVQPYTY